MQAIVKMVFVLFKHKNVRFLFNVVAEDFWDVSIAGKQLETYLKNRYKLVNYFLLAHLTTSIFYVILHLLFAEVSIPEGRTRWLPTLIALPWNQDDSPLHEILLVILTWNMFMSVFGNAIFDFFFVYACQHLGGQFMLLKGMLGKLDRGLMEHCGDVEKFKSAKFQRGIQARMATCVKHHNLLLR